MEKEILEKRLETVKKQLTNNTILAIIAILVLVFVPWVQFENFVFRISLENIIAFIVLIICIVRGFSLRGKKEEIEAELSIYTEKRIKEEKQEPKKEIEPEYYCEYCDKKFKSEEALDKHYAHCEAKKERAEKDKKIAFWVIGLIIFFGFGIYFLINNKINLIPLILVGFIITPFFDKVFNWYKKKNKKIKHFEFNWWKKTIVIVGVILVFVLINLIIPECPKSCDDNNPCTNDFCSSETGYKCMNTIKLNCDGNGICEAGEYGKSADCPDCDDGNKCTADSYDAASKQCVHVEMKGCINE